MGADGPGARAVFAWMATLLSLLGLLAASTRAEDFETPLADYRAALTLAGEGDTEGALARLRQANANLPTTPAALNAARKARLDLVEGLLAAETDAVQPVIRLHELAYLAYREEGLLPLAFHSRTMMYLLCELFAERAKGERQLRIASDHLVSLGAYFHETTSGPSAAELFARALDLDRENELALLSAAIAAEQQARYSVALRFLEELRRAHPGNAEGRLRLALNLRRAERDGDATGTLRRLLSQEAPDWVLSLAHQTLADWRLKAGDLENAESILRSGHERFPDDPTLAIALAYVTERLEPSASAEGLEDQLRIVALSEEVPPRLCYALEPVARIDNLRADLERQADATRALLSAALSRQAMTPAE